MQRRNTLLAAERIRSHRRTERKISGQFLCQVMGVNRSGYYKWRQRQGKMNRYERDRAELTRLLQAAHEKHPSHGYHRLAHDVFLKTGWVFFSQSGPQVL